MEKKRVVERIPIEGVVLEISLDGKRATIVFEAQGKQYALKYKDFNNDIRPLDVMELDEK